LADFTIKYARELFSVHPSSAKFTWHPQVGIECWCLPTENLDADYFSFLYFDDDDKGIPDLMFRRQLYFRQARKRKAPGDGGSWIFFVTGGFVGFGSHSSDNCQHSTHKLRVSAHEDKDRGDFLRFQVQLEDEYEHRGKDSDGRVRLTYEYHKKSDYPCFGCYLERAHPEPKYLISTRISDGIRMLGKLAESEEVLTTADAVTEELDHMLTALRDRNLPLAREHLSRVVRYEGVKAARLFL
jgi:hypothetical protein